MDELRRGWRRRGTARRLTHLAQGRSSRIRGPVRRDPGSPRVHAEDAPCVPRGADLSHEELACVVFPEKSRPSNVMNMRPVRHVQHSDFRPLEATGAGCSGLHLKSVFCTFHRLPCPGNPRPHTPPTPPPPDPTEQRKHDSRSGRRAAHPCRSAGRRSRLQAADEEVPRRDLQLHLPDDP